MALTNHIVPDSPTNNFCTLNPLDNASVLSDGSLVTTGNNTWRGTNSTFKLPSTGKWYFESSTSVISQRTVLGFTTDSLSKTSTWQVTVGFVGLTVDQSSVNAQDNQSSYTNLWTKTTGSFGIQMVLQMCVDCATGNVWFGYNGNWYDSTGSATGNPSAGTNPTATLTTPTDWCPAIQSYDTNNDLIINFGQDPTFAGNKSPTTTYPDANGIGAFYYQPPTGALALCTANLPDFTPTVTGDTPQDYFKAVKYTGDGGTQSITGVGFQPDLVWVKNRTDATSHILSDVIRTAGKAISSESTAAEYNIPTDFQSFDADGFTVGYGGSNITNGSGKNYVAWCWKAGGAPTADNTATSGAMTANSVSLNGTLQSNYTPAGSPTIYPKRMSINTDAGFSIVKYNGNSGGGDVPHGLSQKPDMLIVRPLTAISSWIVWHKGLEELNFDFLYLDEPNSGGSLSNYWGSTGITNTKFGLYAEGTGAGINYTYAGTSPYPHIAYCWHSVEGYSKFGSYSGSYSDLPYIYTGFKPAFVMIKCSSSDISGYASWIIYDNARDPYNQMNKVLYANKSVGEGYRGNGTSTYSALYLDFLSNGFKIRVSAGETNDSSEPTYIYAAFAEQPFKFSNAR